MLNPTHKHIVLNLTGLKGLARKVVTLNAIRVLRGLQYEFPSPVDLREVVDNALFLAICTHCGTIHYSKNELFALNPPPSVKVIDAATDYNAFIGEARKAADAVLYDAIEDVIGMIEHLQRYDAHVAKDRAEAQAEKPATN